MSPAGAPTSSVKKGGSAKNAGAKNASSAKNISRAGRPRREHADQRHNQLLDVAITTFIEQGYSGATIDGIALAAGVGKQTIYSRYPDKEALFSAAVKRLTERHVFDEITADESLDLEESLALRAGTFMRAILKPESFALYTLLQREGHRFPELGRVLEATARIQLRSPLTRYFKHQIERGVLQKIDPSRAARLFMYLAVGEVNRCLLLNAPRPSEREIDKYAREIARLFLHGLAA